MGEIYWCMRLVGVVVRRYIDFLMLLIPTPLVSALFCSSIPTFWSFSFNVFRSCNTIQQQYIQTTRCQISHFVLLVSFFSWANSTLPYNLALSILHINLLHFLVQSEVFSQLSCNSS